MKRKHVIPFLLILISIGCQAMSHPDKNKIPVPEKNFHAVVKDMDDVEIQGNHLAIEGYTYIAGKRGSVDVFIPFEKIDRIIPRDNKKVIMQKNTEIPVDIFLKDGTNYSISVKSDAELTGETSFGKFRVPIKHIHAIQIVPETGLKTE